MSERFRPKVVIVDNDADLVHTIAKSLNGRLKETYPDGCDVVEVVTGDDFRPYSNLTQELIAQSPDVVISGGRNRNDSNGYDWSGITLLTQLSLAGITGLISMAVPGELLQGLQREGESGAPIVSIPKYQGTEAITQGVLDLLDNR